MCYLSFSALKNSYFFLNEWRRFLSRKQNSIGVINTIFFFNKQLQNFQGSNHAPGFFSLMIGHRFLLRFFQNRRSKIPTTPTEPVGNGLSVIMRGTSDFVRMMLRNKNLTKGFTHAFQAVYHRCARGRG
jgi:hypothetical protein